MSCYGSRTTPLFEIKLDHVVDFDDFGGDKNAFQPKIKFFARIWTWELDAVFTPQRRRTAWTSLRHLWEYRHLGIPHVGFFDWDYDTYPTHQYSGDFTENLDERRKATQ